MTVLVWNCLESSSLFPFFIVLLLAIILVWNFLTPLLCDRNLTSHCIAWLAECERAKWNVPSANSNQGRFSISMNQIFAICRKNSHALNSLPLKWIYKCMSEYVKECKVGECKEWFTYTKIRCKGDKNRHFFRMFCNIYWLSSATFIREGKPDEQSICQSCPKNWFCAQSCWLLQCFWFWFGLWQLIISHEFLSNKIQ